MSQTNRFLVWYVACKTAVTIFLRTLVLWNITKSTWSAPHFVPSSTIPWPRTSSVFKIAALKIIYGTELWVTPHPNTIKSNIIWTTLLLVSEILARTFITPTFVYVCIRLYSHSLLVSISLVPALFSTVQTDLCVILAKVNDWLIFLVQTL